MKNVFVFGAALSPNDSRTAWSCEVGAAQQAGNLMLECFGRSDAPGVEAAHQRLVG